MDRPAKCPYPDCCDPLWQSADPDQRLCGGVRKPGGYVNHDGLIDSMTICDDCDPEIVDIPDLFYFCQRAITLMKYALANNLPNACPDLAIMDPVGELIKLLGGNKQ